MGQALDATAYVHQGFWVNQDKGGVLGLTLTVSSTSATLLTNVVALFVTMAGGQFWTILRFSLHQIRALSGNSSGNTLHNQQQVILRNTTSATATAQTLLYLKWSSRKTDQTCAQKSSSLLVVVLAIFCAAFFILAGAFSSTVMDAGPYVISKSPFCGFFNQSYLDIAQGIVPVSTVERETMVDEYVSWDVRDVEHSLQYSEDCYLTDGTGSTNCNTFKKSKLPIATYNNGTCPFNPKLCLDNVDTIVFDTGPINTHHDLGINAAPADRLVYRRVNNCTVLNGTSYGTGWMNQTSGLTAEPIWKIANVSYGRSINWDLVKNVTYSYSNFADFYTATALESSLSYSLGSDQTYVTAQNSLAEGSTFIPLPEFEQKNADIFLFHLSYIGVYLSPVDDPWFSAHQPFSFKVAGGNTVVTYMSDEPITTSACTEQHQICTDVNTCTPLYGYVQLQDYITKHMKLTPKQNVTLNQLWWSATTASLFQIPACLAMGTAPLLATEKRLNGRHTVSVPLPHDQWKLELSNWMTISMAHLQRTTVESETGQIAAQPQYLLKPATDSEKWLCNNLLIRSEAYQSFSVIALAALIFGGTLVIVSSLTIESLSISLLRIVGRGQTGETGNEIWRAHDMLGRQLWSSRLEAIKAGSLRSRPLRNDSLASWDTMSGPGDEKGRKRVSSQALSFDDHERLLIAKAYESWI
jgi:hypothetical protein